MSNEKRADAAMRVQLGRMNPGTLENLRTENEKAGDWECVCRRCGAAMKGTLKEIRAHGCKDR